MSGRLKTGNAHYQHFRLKYAQVPAPGKQLIVKDKAQGLNTKHRDALLEVMGHRYRMQPLLAWLAEDEACNQRSLVALLKARLGLRPCSGPKHTSCITQIMHRYVRAKAREHWGGGGGHAGAL